MIVIKTKKDIAAYISTSPVVLECKEAHEEDDHLEAFAEIEKELARLIAIGDDSPDFGDDWEPWLTANIDQLLEEAISIVM